MARLPSGRETGVVGRPNPLHAVVSFVSWVCLVSFNLAAIVFVVDASPEGFFIQYEVACLGSSS